MEFIPHGLPILSCDGGRRWSFPGTYVLFGWIFLMREGCIEAAVKANWMEMSQVEVEESIMAYLSQSETDACPKDCE